jgi:hypothetical protein
MKTKIIKDFSKPTFIAKYMVAFMGVTLFLLSSVV